MMLQPPGFDSGKKYPVLVFVYGGPNSQVVSKCAIQWNLSIKDTFGAYKCIGDLKGECPLLGGYFIASFIWNVH